MNEKNQSALRHFLLALQFFTRIPVTGKLGAWVGYSPEMLSASSAYFPAVGWVIGGVAAVVMGVALAWLPMGALGALAAAFIATIGTVWLTGAFHEDGLADTADGLGGNVSRERALQIMKDSRIGSYGTVALILALGLKVVLLGSIAQSGAWTVMTALLAAHVLSRLAPLVVMRTLPYVSDAEHSKSKPIAEAVTGLGFRTGCLWSIPALLLIWQAHGFGHLIVALILWTAALAFMLRWLRRRLQGFTGDTLGAVQQVCELALYLGLAVQ
ncbi:adenosylcobinamide-GDP ribazoletransferase [Ottowia thiooxydans]|uniref:adenosylcobinamide-GDP ribazoletransferase n=1 Tax=Ottowia thiooxydans TaxID=219182 RepID=UPI0003F8464D|nr:adenosylcobinamide-GDP ribazoletransferase [Ottowia thiooxydans]